MPRCVPTMPRAKSPDAPRKVILAPEALEDLLDIYDYIAEAADAARAYAYTQRILGFCERLSLFPERGRRHDALRPGLRTIGFERRALIAFHVTPDLVVIDRILYGGRDLAKAFGAPFGS